MSIIITTNRTIICSNSANDIIGMIENSENGFIKIIEPDFSKETEEEQNKFSRIKLVNSQHIVEFF